MGFQMFAVSMMAGGLAAGCIQGFKVLRKGTQNINGTWGIASIICLGLSGLSMLLLS